MYKCGLTASEWFYVKCYVTVYIQMYKWRMQVLAKKTDLCKQCYLNGGC